uniref:Rho family GTPase 3 n=1 Tax=Felis catus TaxID=9685 RepID=A0ABI7ZH42_FELCA
ACGTLRVRESSDRVALGAGFQQLQGARRVSRPRAWLTPKHTTAHHQRTRRPWVNFASSVGFPQSLLGSPYYDNVRPLSYPDSDAVLICFDISRPETLDSVLKKWKGEIQEFCPNTKMLLVGCKSDLRTDVSTLVELSNHRQTPVSYDQGANMAKQIGAATYIECSALQSENSVRDIFHVATLACVNKTNKNVKRNKSQRATKRISHMPSRPELSAVATDLRKDKAKSCTVM